jgi:steroid delta-isomerase-like uncharacterized protein
MSTEANKAIAHRFLEGYNQQNVAIFEEVCAAECTVHDGDHTTDYTLADWTKGVSDIVFSALPDCRCTIHETIATQDRVIVRYTFGGTHKGAFFDAPPTGKWVAAIGIDIYAIAGGKINEVWISFDYLGWFQQLGVIPPLGESEE